MRNNPRTKADDARRLGLAPKPQPVTTSEQDEELPAPHADQPAREPADELLPPTSTRGARRPRT